MRPLPHSLLAAALWAALVCPTACISRPTTQPALSFAAPQDLFVSPSTGNDAWTGSFPIPNGKRTGGPVQTLEHARDLLRARRMAQGNRTLPTTVWLRTGRYQIDRPLDFTAADSYVTYAAYPGEHPILTASHPVTNWRPATANDRPAWSARLPDAWDVRVLTLDGQYAPRPRLPKIEGDGSKNVFRVQWAPNVPVDKDGRTSADTFKGADSFVARDGDVQPFHNLTDVEAVVLHFWIEERMPIESFDPATRRVTFTRKTQMSLADDHTGKWGRYYLDNVFEAMTSPGDWYFDRPAHTLYYLPRPNQTPATTRIEANGIDHLLNITGTTSISFRGLALTGSGWHHPSEPLERKDPNNKPPAGMTQTAATLPAAVTLTRVTNCRIEDCELSNIGLHAIELAEGCVGNRIVGNHIHHTGGGGLKINGGAAGAPADTLTHDNAITDNHIHHVGRVFHSAAAVLVQNAYAITVAHNDVHDGYQMAIPVGWSWGYGPNVARDIHIEYNHIHHFGQGWLSDMGGVYTLGPQPGTTVRNNLVHDVYAATYGGWCIYPDEGSSGILIENNVAYDTSNNAFHQHYGKENVVRNNVFAFGHVATFEITRKEPHTSLTMDHNILVTDTAPIYGPSIDNAHPTFTSDHNILFSTATTTPRATASKDLAAWRKTHHDEHSTVIDPRFRDLPRRDFTLPPDSPVYELGFRPIDLSTIGPRPKDQRD